MGTPEELAGAVIYLLPDAASYISDADSLLMSISLSFNSNISINIEDA